MTTEGEETDFGPDEGIRGRPADGRFRGHVGHYQPFTKYNEAVVEKKVQESEMEYKHFPFNSDALSKDGRTQNIVMARRIIAQKMADWKERSYTFPLGPIVGMHWDDLVKRYFGGDWRRWESWRGQVCRDYADDVYNTLEKNLSKTTWVVRG